MQLLYSRADPGPEFASLSMLLRTDTASGELTCHMVEPLLLPSPLSTISQPACVEALSELHLYVNSVLMASNSNGNSKDKQPSNRFLQDDDEKRLLSSTQIFRPRSCHGIALQYRLIKDHKRISPLIPLILNSSTSGPSSKSGTALSMVALVEKEVNGIVLCVGISGIPSAFGKSSLTYSMSQKMSDCIDILCKLGAATSSSSSSTTDVGSASTATASAQPPPSDLTAARSLLTTMLLTDDEDRMTNFMASGTQRIFVAQEEEGGGLESSQFSKILGSNKKQRDVEMSGFRTGADDDENALHVNSADQARIVVERLAVLSVCESHTNFRKYEARTRDAEKGGKKRLRKTARDADLDGFDFKGEVRSTSNKHVLATTSSAMTSNVAPASDISATLRSTTSHSSSLALRGPKKDTTSRTTSKAKQQSVPALLASSKDSGAMRNRRISLDQLGTNSRNRGTGSRRTSGANNSGWAGDGPLDGVPSSFGTSIHSRAQSVRSVQSDGASLSSVKTPPGSTGSRSQSQSRQQFDPFASSAFSYDTSTTTSETTYGHDLASTNGNHGLASARVLVNIALNEDLTCFYKLSKMSSCSVEGVVQVQVRSNVDQGVPFFLQIRDPSKHIQSIQENKKFADNMAELLATEHHASKPDYMFTVSIPKSDGYFPVMRYKCGDDLRPVPIRVQTRVRLEDNSWRVALQISSNPHNEDNLTDLTIIMGVPTVVRGDSLTTSPPGGVWNASKRSVIWCVSELGGGEKFQLQARFEIDPDVPDDSGDDKPKFPVLVRCQCMYAQLSDVEVDVRDIPQVLQADVKMKLARRFRLSHRERP